MSFAKDGSNAVCNVVGQPTTTPHHAHESGEARVSCSRCSRCNGPPFPSFVAGISGIPRLLASSQESVGPVVPSGATLPPLRAPPRSARRSAIGTSLRPSVSMLSLGAVIGAPSVGAIPRRSQPVVVSRRQPVRPTPVVETLPQRRRGVRADLVARGLRASPYSVPRSLDEILAGHGVGEVQPRHGRSRGRSRSQRRRGPTRNRGPIARLARLSRGAAASGREVGSSWHFGGLLVVEARWHQC